MVFWIHILISILIFYIDIATLWPWCNFIHFINQDKILMFKNIYNKNLSPVTGADGIFLSRGGLLNCDIYVKKKKFCKG